MKQLLLILLFLPFGLLSQFGAQPNPGNLGTGNLTAWFNPASLGNGNVTNWTTTYPNLPLTQISITDNAAPYPTATETPPNASSNYNRTIQFSNPTGINQALTNTGYLDLLLNTLTGDEGTFFMAYYIPVAKVNAHMLLYNNGNAGIQFRNLGTITRLALSNGFGDTPNGCRERQEDFLPVIVSYKGNRSGSNTMSGYENDQNLPVGVASQSTGPPGFYMGCYGGDNGSGYTGFIHETIFYNRDLTAVEMRKVHSYLAIKYGITLENTGGGNLGDYLNTNGTLIWDASLNLVYHNDVIGISRDSRQTLLQKQSHSFDDKLRIYIDTLRTTNLSNTGTFLSDTSSVLVGHNNANVCSNTASAAEAPAGISARLAREWKVTKSNFAQDFHVDLAIDTCNSPGFSIGTIDFSQMKLLVDDDGDFSNAQVFDQSNGLTFSMQNEYITIRNIGNSHIPNNSTRYFTLAYNSPYVTLSGPDSLCAGESAWYYWTVYNTNIPFDFSYSDGNNTFSINNVSSGDSILFTPSTTTTYTIFNNPNFITCCSGANNTTFTINMAVSSQIFANASDTLVCFGDTVLIYGSGAQSYIWSNGAPDSSYIVINNNTFLSVTGIDSVGCSGTDSIAIYLNSSGNMQAIASDTLLCFGESVILYGTGGTNYMWSNGVQDSVAFAPTETATYYLTGDSGGGCLALDSVHVTVAPLLNVLANSSLNSICSGDSLILYGSGASYYNWTPAIADSQYFQPPNSTWFHVTGSDDFGCSDSDSIFITVNPTPIVVASANNSEICEGETIILSGSGATTYNWNMGAMNNTPFQPQSSTMYTLIGSTQEGCSSLDSIFITVHARPIVLANATDSVICYGEMIQLFGTGAQSYSWSNAVLDGQNFQPQQSQVYTVIGTDANGCRDTASVSILVNPLNPFDLGNDTSLCYGDEINLGPPAIYSSYNWNNGAISSSILVNQKGTYVLEATDLNGCLTDDSIQISIRFDCDTVTYNPLVFIPNAFTPDGNMFNNTFLVIASDIEEFQMRIYNRWGELLFESFDLTEGWDGTYGGKLVQSGMYVYKVTYREKRDYADPKEIHGTFHLLR